MAASITRALVVVLGCVASACASHTSTGGVITAPSQDEERPQTDGGHKSYVLPAAEILAMDGALNLAGRAIYGPAPFEVTATTIRHNLRGPWVVDDDPFQVNQFGHPYQGAMYHDIARSNGLDYWASMAYTFASSALWELAGETTPPSRNDQIASGIAGSFLGEPLFRVSRLLLERADQGPGVWRTVASILVSPPTGLNHLMVGRPAGRGHPDAVAYSDIRAQFGVTAITSGHSRAISSLALDQPRVALSMDYGYPGSPGYRHSRPFDYFRIESSVSGEGLEHLSTRGLIAGGDYGAGPLAGVVGLYGTYDYFAPHDFRFSSTSFSFGTTLQAPLTESLVVQSSGLIGGGYVAAYSEDRSAGRNDHYGAAPQALANVRLIAGRRAAVDLTAREYYISTLGGFGTGQRDLIFVGDAWLAVRVVGKHAVGLTYQLAGRTSDYLQLPDQTQARSTVGVYYTFLGSRGFGAVR
jgi:hypothetical protein